ncbi:MAG: hypothetical protein AAGI38_15380 [Bacteroidota bacterium]
MKAQIRLFILFFIVVNSCTPAPGIGETAPEQPIADQITRDTNLSGSLQPEKEIPIFTRVKKFATHVHGDEFRTHKFPDPDKAPKHLTIFSKEGLKRIAAFSNENYPKSIEPYQYEHFLLFSLEYTDEHKAQIAFEQLKELANTNRFELDALSESEQKRVNFFFDQSKSGGMILQKGRWIFSLVKTCRNTPIGGTWTAYEEVFVSFLKEGHQEQIETLNADCGAIEYRLEER